MPQPQLTPIVEGPADGETLFFIQGWPDDHTLWDGLVARLRDRYRCVRIDLPNYPRGERRRWGYAHEEIVAALVECIRSVSPGKPVTLIIHDWGAHWGWWLHHRHPELVSRIVGLDIAPELRPSPREIVLIAAYQWWLLSAFVLGGPIGDAMTRSLARAFHAPRQGSAVDSSMNYPYLYVWRDIVTGRARKTFAGYEPDVPVLFVYGENKPARFHSERWLARIRSRPGSAVVALDGRGHWVTKDPRLNDLVCAWLDGGAQTAK